MKGYLTGLRHWRMAVAAESPRRRSSVRSRRRRAAPPPFLRTNPYPRPLTEGLFYREKMRAIHRVAPPTGHPACSRSAVAGAASPSRLFPGAQVDQPRPRPGLRRRDRTDGAPFVAADATRLPVPPTGAFDVVTLFDVLEHIHDDARRPRRRRSGCCGPAAR